MLLGYIAYIPTRAVTGLLSDARDTICLTSNHILAIIIN